jgi:tRNA 2-thiouridine synthesizing protein A
VNERAPVVLDCLGEFCPVPLMKLSKLVATSEPGTVIEVLSDDEGSKVDIPVWCRMKSHDFVGQSDRAQGWSFLVRVSG